MNALLLITALILGLGISAAPSRVDGPQEQPVALGTRVARVHVTRTDGKPEAFTGKVQVCYLDANGTQCVRYEFAKNGVADVTLPERLGSSRIYIEVGYISDLWCFAASAPYGTSDFYVTYAGINPRWTDHSQSQHGF